MISIEEAKKRILGLDVSQIRELTKNRLLGTDSTPFGSGHSFEPSEDLVIQLLSDPTPDADVRKAVVEGCADVYAKLLGWLASPKHEERISYWQDVSIRISRVVDVTAPVELMGHANSVLELALQNGEKMSELLGAAIRACMGYKSMSMLAMWKGIIDKYPDVAAYAFNALLDIEPGSREIEEHLEALWQKELLDGWPVDTKFLARRAARVSGNETLIYSVLLKLMNKGQPLWDKVEEKLGEQIWSKKWLEDLRELQRARYTSVREQEITSESEKSKEADIDLPYAVFSHGFAPGSFSDYYGHLFIKSHPSDIDWVDYISRILRKMNIKGRVSLSPYVKKVSKEIKNVS
jgi:hypothetical protein